MTLMNESEHLTQSSRNSTPDRHKGPRYAFFERFLAVFDTGGFSWDFLCAMLSSSWQLLKNTVFGEQSVSPIEPRYTLLLIAVIVSALRLDNAGTVHCQTLVLKSRRTGFTRHIRHHKRVPFLNLEDDIFHDDGDLTTFHGKVTPPAGVTW